GAGVVLGRFRRRAVVVGITAALAVLILIEYQLFDPFPTGDATQPAYFRELSNQDDVRAVLDVPVHNSLAAKIGLYQQVFHHQPLIGGHALRRTPQDPALLEVLERAAIGGADGLTPLIPLTPEGAAYVLSVVGADRVIVQKQFVPDLDAALRWLEQVAGGPPDYADSALAVYAIPRATEPPPGLVLAERSEGWYPLEQGGAMLSEAAEWYFYTAAEQYGDLSIPVTAYTIPRRIGVWLDDRLLTAFWATPDQDTARIPLWVDPGFHTLRFAALDGCDPYPFTLTCLDGGDGSQDCERRDSPLCISAAFGSPEWIPSESAPVPLDVTLDHGLRLRAYTLDVTADAVTGARTVDLRLFWQGDHALPDDYALFVHLADPATIEPLAQYDGFPLIRTGDWAGESVWVSAVRIVLPDDMFTDVSAGPLAVNVGWFDPVTGARLAVRSDGPWADVGIVPVAVVEPGP
ncbi:MAG: hypothetical protein JXQ72_15965, partial [Anaerolineae bacterium]|nr:hypothetical protein [Anaerolineae bacterium]